VKWIEEVKDSLDEPITGSAARRLRILGYVLVAPFVALLALGFVVLAAGSIFGLSGWWFSPLRTACGSFRPARSQRGRRVF
jgi:fatty acid desaturase